MQRNLVNDHPSKTNSIADSEYGNGILFRADDVLFSVRRDSCEGWVYTVYTMNPETLMYDTPAGGYIEGLQNCTVSRIASYVASIISSGTDDVFELGLPISEFFHHVRQRPIFTYRGVDVFSDPIYRASAESQSPKIVSLVKRLIDDRLDLSILLYRSRLSGKYAMKLIAESADKRIFSDNPRVSIERPDGSEGCLIYDSSVPYDIDTTDYDVSWALELWMEPVYINWNVDGPWIE